MRRFLTSFIFCPLVQFSAKMKRHFRVTNRILATTVTYKLNRLKSFYLLTSEQPKEGMAEFVRIVFKIDILLDHICL